MYLKNNTHLEKLQIVLAVTLLGCVLAQQQQQQQQMDKQQQIQNVNKEGIAGEPAAAASSSYGSYRSGGYGGSSGYGSNVDPRYFDRGDTPHFGLAGFPFGCKWNLNIGC